MTSSIFLLVVLPLLLMSIAATMLTTADPDAPDAVRAIADALPPWVILVGTILPDFALTVFAAVLTRRPDYLALGVFFPFIRIVDAALCLRALVDALRRPTDGRWRSPARREVRTLAG